MPSYIDAARFGRTALKASVCVTAPLLLAACGGAMESTYRLSADDAGVAVSGVPYYLPLAEIPVTVSFGPSAGTANAPAAAGGGAKTGASAGAAAATKTTADTTAKPVFAVKVDAPVYVPDTSQLFLLQYNNSAEDDNMFSLQVNSAGLLTSNTAEAVDQTPAVITTLAQTAAAFLPPGPYQAPQPKTSPAKKPLPKPAPCALPNFSQQIDFMPAATNTFKMIPGAGAFGYTASDHLTVPDNNSQTQNTADAADQANAGTQWVKVSILAVHAPSSSTQAPSSIASYDSSNLDSPNQSASAGILFRAATMWTIDVTTRVSTAAQTDCQIYPSVTEETVFIPNGGMDFREDVSRAPMVDKKMSITVDNGMLEGVQTSQPSEVLKTVQVPLNVVQAVVKGVTSAVQPIIPAAVPAPAAAEAKAPTGMSAGS